MDKYRIIEQTGKGAFCEVFKAYDLAAHRFVAVKKYIFEFSEIKDKILSEVSTLRSVQHPNVIRLIEAIVEQNQAYLIFELQHCTLIEHYKQVSRKGQALTQGAIKSYVYQIALALDQLHSKNLMHRDIKPQNVMLRRSSQVLKLIDFGFCKSTRDPSQTEYIATRWYRAPELILGLPYSLPVDVFALACVMLELYNGVEVFRGRSSIDQIYKICQVLGNIRDWREGSNKLKQMGVEIKYMPKRLHQLMTNINKEGQELLQWMLVFNPNKRATIKQVLGHPYFRHMGLPAQVLDHMEKNAQTQRPRQNSSRSPREKISLRGHRRVATETNQILLNHRKMTEVDSLRKADKKVPMLNIPRLVIPPVPHICLNTPRALTRIDSTAMVHSDRSSVQRRSVTNRGVVTSRQYRYVRISPNNMPVM